MDIVEKYRDELKKSKKYSEFTITSYCNDVKRFLDFVGKKYSDVEPPDISKFMLENSPATANRRMMSLRNFYRTLNKCGATDIFPFTNEMFKELRAMPKRLSERMTIPEGLGFLEEAKKKTKNYAIMMTFLNTGIRETELFNLERKDFSNGKLKIIGKGNKERIIPVNQATKNAIEVYLADRKDNEKWLFLSNFGKRYSASAMLNLVKRIAERAGIEKNITPHKLRHTFAAMMKSQGRDAYEIMQILGHNDIRTTMIYLGKLDDDRTEAILEESAFNV